MKSLREDLASKEDEELTKDKFKKFRLNDLIDLNSLNKPVAIEDPSSLKRSYENALQDNQTNSTTKKQSKTIVLKKKQPLTNPKSDVPSMESRSNNIESLSRCTW